MDFETRAIHDGQEPDPATGAVITPIYQSSTYAQDDVGVNKGYDYSRAGNPTRTALEACLASLENAKYGLCFASGLGASNTVMNLLSAGDHVICAVTRQQIPLAELKYWSVERQEAYISAEASLQAEGKS